MKTLSVNSTYHPLLGGELITLADAMELTDNFTVEIDGRSSISFDINLLDQLIEETHCEYIFFRYCKSGNISILAIADAGNKNMMAIDTDGNRLHLEDIAQITENFTFQYSGVHGAQYRVDILKQVIEHCEEQLVANFGWGNGKPIFVISPDKLESVAPERRICMDHVQVCPPYCPG